MDAHDTIEDVISGILNEDEEDENIEALDEEQDEHIKTDSCNDSNE